MLSKFCGGHNFGNPSVLSLYAAACIMSMRIGSCSGRIPRVSNSKLTARRAKFTSCSLRMGRNVTSANKRVTDSRARLSMLAAYMSVSREL